MKKMIIVLTGVMILSGLVLASASTMFGPMIEENRRQALANSLAAIFGGAENPSFEQLASEDPTVYRGTSEGGELLGYAVELEATGYAGGIRMLVGLDARLSDVTGIEIVEQAETPGLGGRISEESFQDRFSGLSASGEVQLVKNRPADASENEVEAISGATISSRAVVTGVNRAIDVAPEVIEEQANGR
jgi:electron transport complex protein RnfG